VRNTHGVFFSDPTTIAINLVAVVSAPHRAEVKRVEVGPSLFRKRAYLHKNI